MYFASCLMTILSLLGVASFNFVLQNFDLEPDVSTALKWLTLTSAGSLVFAVQLGVQTLPTLLSGELYPPCHTRQYNSSGFKSWAKTETPEAVFLVMYDPSMNKL